MSIKPTPLSQLLAASNASAAALFSNTSGTTTTGPAPLPNCVLYAFPPSLDSFRSLSHAFAKPNGETLKTADSRRIRHRLTEIKSKLLDPTDSREEIPCTSVQWTDLMHELYTNSGYFGIVKYDQRGGKGSSAEIWQAYLNRGEDGCVQYTEKEKRHEVARSLVQKGVVIIALRMHRNGTIYCSLITEDTNMMHVHPQEPGPIAERPKLTNPWVETARKKKQRIMEMGDKKPQDYKYLWRTTAPGGTKTTDDDAPQDVSADTQKNTDTNQQNGSKKRKRRTENRVPTETDVVIILSDSDDDLVITEPLQKKRNVEKTHTTQRLMTLLSDDT